MVFGQAIEDLKRGNRVAREGWNGKDMWLIYRRGGDSFLIGDDYYEESPFTAIKTVDGKLVPWLPSQTDALAEDWEIIK